MRIQEFIMHLQAGEYYGINGTCISNGKPKMQYATEETAIKNAVHASVRYDKDMEAYPCPFCFEWHVGRKMTDEERQRFTPQVRLGSEIKLGNLFWGTDFHQVTEGDKHE